MPIPGKSNRQSAVALRKPITGSAGCCARAASGHAAAAPPSSVMNSRRLTWSIGDFLPRVLESSLSQDAGQGTWDRPEFVLNRREALALFHFTITSHQSDSCARPRRRARHRSARPRRGSSVAMPGPVWFAGTSASSEKYVSRKVRIMQRPSSAGCSDTPRRLSVGTQSPPARARAPSARW